MDRPWVLAYATTIVALWWLDRWMWKSWREQRRSEEIRWWQFWR